MKNQKNKTAIKTKTTKTQNEIPKDKKHITKRPTPLFREIFHTHFTFFLIKKLLGIIHLRYCVTEIMLSVKYHLLLKAVVFVALFRVISFSILLIFQISAIRLFIFMHLFSLDL